MKKIVLTLTTLFLMANALAQAPFRIDTSYQTYQQFDYDAWVREDSLMRSKVLSTLAAPDPIYGRRGGQCASDVLQYNYTDNQKGLNVVGISAVISTNMYSASFFDTVRPTEYLMLYDDSAGIFLPKAQIAISYIDTVGWPRFYWSVWIGLCGEEHWANEGYAHYLTRVYNYYFDEPITVYDSFYVGCSDRYDVPFLTGGDWYDPTIISGQNICFRTFTINAQKVPTRIVKMFFIIIFLKRSMITPINT